MATPINVRSPKIMTINGAVNDDTKVEIYLWKESGSIPTNPTYTLEKQIVDSLVGNVYDVSPFAKTFIKHKAFTEITSDTAMDEDEYCYCHLKLYVNGAQVDVINEFICFAGFGYHSEGANPTHSLFLNEGKYYVNLDDNSGALAYYDDGSETWIAQYAALDGSFTTNVTLSNGVGYVPYIHSLFSSIGNKLTILKDGVQEQEYYFIPGDSCKFTPINCDFVNKFGAWQRIVFFKASKSTFSVSSTEYNLMPSSAIYDVQDNVRSAFNLNGKDKITVNTGWVFESYSDVIKQLMLSEKILLDDKPVLISTKSIELQESINNNNINYKLDFEYSAPTLNYNL